MGRRKLTSFNDPQIAVALTDEEQRIKAKELADLCGEIDKRRADAADSASTSRKAVRALEKRRRVLAECVRTGAEMRDAQLALGNEPKSKRNGSTETPTH
jgi:uncharacterized coiled-coil DUF342 family protein